MSLVSVRARRLLAMRGPFVSPATIRLSSSHQPKVRSLNKAYRNKLEEVDPADPQGRTFAEAIAEKLVAGMPAEVVVPTGERTVLAYLVTPLVERFHTSMRER